MSRLCACVVFLALALSPPTLFAHAQQPPRPAPPRDKPTEQTGTAIIRGRVIGGDTRRPLRRARVTISAPALTTGRSTSTDADGRYEFKDLPESRYRVSVSRGGYLKLEYGQRRPGEQGRPVNLATGEVQEKVDFALPRMSVITGRVTDDMGEPIEGVAVFAMRLVFYEGRRKLVPAGSLQIRTDDAGEYRLSRLAPGAYYVMASTHETWNVKENGRDVLYGYLPTYHPSVINATAARRIDVGIGREVPGIDIGLVPGRAAKVSGTAVDSKGRPFSKVSLNEEVRGLEGASFGGGPSGPVAADGTFAIVDVPPGEYVAVAFRMPDEAGGEPEAALMPLVVEASDIENLTLVGSAGGSVSGRVVSESGTLPKGTIRIQIFEPLRSQPSPTLLGLYARGMTGPGSAQMSEDGSFLVEHIFGRARVQVTLPQGWMLKSVSRGSDDITDAPLELRSGETVSGVEIAITDRVTSVSGRVLDDKQAPITDATVLVFTTDSSKWFEKSRLVRAERPDQQGRWEIKGLPPGEYQAIALEYVEDTAWYDPDYLESLREQTEKVTIPEGGSQTITLALVKPKQF